MEDGNEIKNRLVGNIGILAKKPTAANALLVSDFAGGQAHRFQPTSTFWIAHPDNYVVGNVASGSQGSGFWMAFIRQTYPNAVPTAFPVSSDTLAFDNNIAHSCPVGITHDGAPDGALKNNALNSLDRALTSAHYHPPNVPVFNNLLAYKCSQAGYYFRGERAIYKNSIGADNTWTAFYAYDQELIDFLIVGISDNEPKSGFSPGDHIGLLLYDGPFWAENVHFTGFNHPSKTSTAILVLGGAALFVNNAKGITFDATPPPRKLMMDPSGAGWGDTYSSCILDIDGTLAGTPGALVRPDHPMNQDYRCRKGSASSGELFTLICSYDISYLRLYDVTGGNANSLDFGVSRRTISTGATTATFNRGNKPWWNKFSMITGNTYQYHVSQMSWRPGQTYIMIFLTKGFGVNSPVVTFEGAPGSCRVLYHNAQLPGVSSLAALQNTNNAAYFRSGSNLHVKFSTKHVHGKKRSDTFRGDSHYQMVC